MPVSIDEVSAEVTPPPSEAPGRVQEAAPPADAELERRRLQDLLRRLALRAERVRAD